MEHTFSRSPNFVITSISSSPTLTPVWCPTECLKLMRWLFSTQTRGASGDSSMYWMENDENEWRRIADQLSITSDARDDLEDIVNEMKNSRKEWLTVIIPWSISSSFSIFSATVLPRQVLHGISLSFSVGHRYQRVWRKEARLTKWKDYNMIE